MIGNLLLKLIMMCIAQGFDIEISRQTKRDVKPWRAILSLSRDNFHVSWMFSDFVGNASFRATLELAIKFVNLNPEHPLH